MNATGPTKPLSSLRSVDEFNAANAWQGRSDDRLRLTNAGNVRATLGNIVLVLQNDPAWEEVLALNEHAGVIVKRQEPPFQNATCDEWTDADDSRLKHWLDVNYGIGRISDGELGHALNVVADQNRFHAVKDYLESLRWDKNKRLEHWLDAYLGADDTEYHKLVGVKFMVGAVARILRSPRPTKMDNVLILEGPQYAGKSTTVKILFWPWFTDAGFEIGSTDVSCPRSLATWHVRLSVLHVLQNRPSLA